jgi:hypothetical protein
MYVFMQTPLKCAYLATLPPFAFSSSWGEEEEEEAGRDLTL